MIRSAIVLAFAVSTIAVFGQSLEATEERLRVTNTTIPIYAKKIHVSSRPTGIQLVAHLLNEGTETLFDFYLAVTITRKTLPPITHEVRLDAPLQTFLTEILTLHFDTKIGDVDSVRLESRGFTTQSELDEVRAKQAAVERAAEQKRLAIQRAADARRKSQIAAEELKAAQKRHQEQYEKQVRIEQSRRNCQEFKSKILNRQIGSLTVAEKDMYDACRAAGLW